MAMEGEGEGMQSRVEQYEVIRRQHRDEGLGIRELARRHRVHRRTVRLALANAVPPERKTPERVAPVLGSYESIVRGWLEADRQVPVKQRHTARRVWQRLRDEHGASVGESSVRRLVAGLQAELNRDVGRVTIPQTHAPGEEAEVDFGEFGARVAGTLLRLWLFVMRLSYSGRGFAFAYAHQAQEAFLDGHVRAFAHFDGVPAGQVRYDNLKPAVQRILLGRDRVETERFVALRSHYGFDSFFCQPGADGAHEKGGVEGEVGRFRRAHLVPVPEVASLAELNELLAVKLAADDARRIAQRAETVGQAFTVEQARLHPLPDEPFDPARLLSAKVDTKARVCVLQSWYSVPARLAGRRVQVRLGAGQLEILHEGRAVAVHQRSLHKGSQDLVLDHYLEVLARKPGALPGSTALAQARTQGAFTPDHDRFWSAARRQLGDAAGTRALIEVLLAHRHLSADAITAGIQAALGAGQVNPELLTIEGRHPLDPGLAPLIAITQALARYDRPTPRLDRYDQLLDPPATTATVIDLEARQ
jgi:transposase